MDFVGILPHAEPPDSMKFLIALIALISGCQANPNQPVELGTVKWSRELKKSLGASKASGKPVFLLFQEVPG